MLHKRTTIGVIGHTGTVGAAVYAYFKSQHVSVLGFSRHARDQSPPSAIEDMNTSCSVIFICVPTPLDKKLQLLDISVIEDILRKLTAPKTVVIKSTVLPGTTQELQKKYSALRLLYNPEFLSRATAWRDFIHPDRQLMGYTDQSKSIARTILRILPQAVYSKILRSADAEIIKMAHNVYGAMNVTYANYLFDICEKIGADYEQVKKGFVASRYVQKGMLRYMTIYHNNKRGYGGSCFPKDVKSFVTFCQTSGIDTELVRAVENMNTRILATQGLTELDIENK